PAPGAGDRPPTRGRAHQPAELGRQRQAGRSVPDPGRGESLMGALARLLGRREGETGTSGPTASHSRARAPQDLLLASGMTREELRICWIAVSWLLTYPDQQTLERLPAVRELVSSLPEPARGGVRRTIDA